MLIRPRSAKLAHGEARFLDYREKAPGSSITPTVANDLISVIDNGLNIQETADAPRFHHQYLPDILQFEKSFSGATIDALKAAGYSTKLEAEFDEKSAGVWGDSELIANNFS